MIKIWIYIKKNITFAKKAEEQHKINYCSPVKLF